MYSDTFYTNFRKQKKFKLFVIVLLVRFQKKNTKYVLILIDVLHVHTVYGYCLCFQVLVMKSHRNNYYFTS